MFIKLEEQLIESIQSIQQSADHVLVTTESYDIRLWPVGSVDILYSEFYNKVITRGIISSDSIDDDFYIEKYKIIKT